MVIPLYDDNPFAFRSPPYVTWALIVVNALVFVITLSAAASGAVTTLANMLAFTPSPVVPEEAPVVPAVPWALTFVTYMFLHANWFHLIGNMLFLWVFGDDIEEALGHFRFLVFYLLCGIAGAAAHYLAGPTLHTPLIGASGAVAGIIAAYLMLRPCQKVWVLLLSRIPVKLSAYWALGFWVVMQVVNVMVDEHGQTSWAAHIGGVIAGALLVIVLRQPGVKLFDCPPALVPIAGANATDRDAPAR
jgi:membrane associated rhomboid family serine protease